MIRFQWFVFDGSIFSFAAAIVNFKFPNDFVVCVAVVICLIENLAKRFHVFSIRLIRFSKLKRASTQVARLLHTGFRRVGPLYLFQAAHYS